MPLVLKSPQGRLLPNGGLKIDWKHPLANGLVACYVPGVSAGNNLVGNGGDLVFAFNGTAIDSISIAQEGPGVATSATGGLRGTTPAAFSAGSNFSYYWRGFVTSSAAINAPAFVIGDSDGWSSPYVFMGIRSDGSDHFKMMTSAGGSFSENTIGGGATVGKTQSVAVTLNYTAGTERGFTNGLFQNSVALGTKTAPAATSQICIGCEPAGGGDQFALNATTNCVFVWTRTLDDTEIAQLDADPYGFLIPAEGEMPALFNPVVLASGSGYGAPKRSILRAYSGGLSLAPRTVPRGKVQIDWSHPLANGLIGCWLPGVSLGLDLTGNCAPATSNINSGQPAFFNTLTTEGPAYGASSTSSVALTTTAPSKFKTWTQLSMYYRGDRNGAGVAGAGIPYLIFISTDNASGSPFAVAAMGDSSGTTFTDFQALWNTSGSFTGGTTNNIDVAGPMSCLATFKVGGNAVVYNKGAQIASDAFGAGAPTSTSTAQISINGWGAIGRYSPTLCNIACVWERELTAYEAALLDADPYCFLIPAEGEMPALFLPSAGGSFLAAWARYSNLPVIGTGNY